MEATFISLDKM